MWPILFSTFKEFVQNRSEDASCDMQKKGPTFLSVHCDSSGKSYHGWDIANSLINLFFSRDIFFLCFVVNPEAYVLMYDKQ